MTKPCLKPSSHTHFLPDSEFLLFKNISKVTKTSTLGTPVFSGYYIYKSALRIILIFYCDSTFNDLFSIKRAANSPIYLGIKKLFYKIV